MSVTLIDEEVFRTVHLNFFFFKTQILYIDSGWPPRTMKYAQPCLTRKLPHSQSFSQ